MKLRDWRTREQKTLKELAELLGIGQGANPSRRVQRIETGEAPVDAILADKIVSVAGGDVTLQDLNETRRAFLEAASEAAE
ncbi:XRE family transcriptional regulator [Mesorhizobium sp. M4A.F.Ca.ET.020.02.1.1]|uniref:helix-turn-helix domain-containing protein n=1 Tax=Mesorhizobium sp. M4A.F.Ca.ET.020.02.1.1 TaxID=2496652 RepID=UPI000FD30DBA|nr:helix-turn-helix transcriptional regulator [Mesorhizobium sp. M4A.F.Ca.ET.020.02.1.1]RVD44902.1 XRE family transcriptional regulator [Mesorhizobium sp. M4A.F.Ca.ET.020.02.1.1]